MAKNLRVAAVDLGAGSGRVIAGEIGPDRLRLKEVHRFPNGPVRVPHERGSSLVWDILRIYEETLAGLRRAHATGPVHGIGIDSWAVDYGLLDEDGALLGNPVCHRDSRTDGVMEKVLQTVPRREMFDITGLQRLPFNTLYQLVAASGTATLGAAQTLLLLPDLLCYWLTGDRGAEATNASTTQLYDVRQRTWATGLARRLGIRSDILPPLREAGDLVGDVLPSVAAELCVERAGPVVAVGSHDTASAVVGVPMELESSAAYISCGTWSLVGVELERPVLTDAAMEANFTNEGGIDGTIRFLRNVTGLWALSETMRAWELAGAPADLPNLLAEAADVPPLRCVVDIDAHAFLAPGDMTGRIEDACRVGGQLPPASRAEITRCILDSLALAYRRNIRLASELSGRDIDLVHVVGGGALNTLLCQLTANACGVPVLAGPIEATAFGNILVQARSLGAAVPDLASMRDLLRRTQRTRRYEPATAGKGWDEAENRMKAAVPVTAKP